MQKKHIFGFGGIAAISLGLALISNAGRICATVQSPLGRAICETVVETAQAEGDSVVEAIEGEQIDAGAPIEVASASDAGCFNNLCGWDSYCSCHRTFTPEYQGQARCYANAQQCEIDLACCVKTPCNGSPHAGDRCTDAVIAAIKAGAVDAGTR